MASMLEACETWLHQFYKSSFSELEPFLRPQILKQKTITWQYTNISRVQLSFNT